MNDKNKEDKEKSEFKNLQKEWFDFVQVDRKFGDSYTMWEFISSFLLLKKAEWQRESIVEITQMINKAQKEPHPVDHLVWVAFSVKLLQKLKSPTKDND